MDKKNGMVTKDIGGKIGVFYWNYSAFYMIAYEISIGLDDPLQHALLCIEEPENQLYPELLNAIVISTIIFVKSRKNGFDIGFVVER